jgi:hypothetical protein
VAASGGVSTGRWAGRDASAPRSADGQLVALGSTVAVLGDLSSPAPAGEVPRFSSALTNAMLWSAEPEWKSRSSGPVATEAALCAGGPNRAGMVWDAYSNAAHIDAQPTANSNL